MPIASADAATLQPGTWSGNGAVLTSMPQHSRIDVGTGVATIAGPLTVDAGGRFKATGVFETYTPGPQRADAPPVMHKAHISGRITGTTIALTMHVEGERAMRTYTLLQGRSVKLIRPL